LRRKFLKFKNGRDVNDAITTKQLWFYASR